MANTYALRIAGLEHDLAARDRRIRDLEERLAGTEDVIRQARISERALCRAAVSRAAAPVTGTPYISGPRAFTAAIDALPPVAGMRP